MSTETYQLSVHGLTIDVVRKDIKNLHLGVYPPAGRIRVAVPLRVNDEAVRLFTVSKLPWINRQQTKFTDLERQSAREYVSGESHYFLGRRYRLNVIYHDGPGAVEVRNRKTMDLFVRHGADLIAQEQVLLGWYRRHLKDEISPLIMKWETATGVSATEWGIKQMKTKWGTCNREASRIWLNLELAKKSRPCIEYVIVHELVHVLERYHDDRFTACMNRFMPL